VEHRFTEIETLEEAASGRQVHEFKGVRRSKESDNRRVRGVAGNS
jgi:hypothetical protein